VQNLPKYGQQAYNMSTPTRDDLSCTTRTTDVYI